MMPKCVLTHGSQNTKSSSGASNSLNLEDRLYQLKEQNTILKREAHNSNYQVKCLNTKLTRLINEKKRLVKGEKTNREVEMEELIFNMNFKLQSLMRENERLHHNTLLLRTQLQPQPMIRPSRPASSYSNVKSRVDTGLKRSSSLSRYKSISMSSLSPAPRVKFQPDLNEPVASTSSRKEVTRRHSAGQNKDCPTSNDITLKLLKEAREELSSLEEVVANQQSYIESCRNLKSSQKKLVVKNGYGARDEQYSDSDEASKPIAIERYDNEKRNKYGVKSEQTQTEVIPMSIIPQLDNRKGSVSEMMTVYLGKLENELRRAREEMSDIQEQLIAAKMNSIKVDELSRKVKSLQRENELLQESLSFKSSEMAINQEDKSLEVLKQSLKHCQLQISLLEQDKQVMEQELTTQREKVRKGMEENFELKSLLNQAKEQIEDTQCNSKIVPSNNTDPHNSPDLTEQLINMEQERNEFLKEFTEMKQMLELMKSSIQECECEENPE